MTELLLDMPFGTNSNFTTHKLLSVIDCENEKICQVILVYTLCMITAIFLLMLLVVTVIVMAFRYRRLRKLFNQKEKEILVQDDCERYNSDGESSKIFNIFDSQQEKNSNVLSFSSLDTHEIINESLKSDLILLNINNTMEKIKMKLNKKPCYKLNTDEVDQELRVVMSRRASRNYDDYNMNLDHDDSMNTDEDLYNYKIMNGTFFTGHMSQIDLKSLSNPNYRL